MKLGKDVFTTGQVAKLLGVAPRTVSKWFDSGKLCGYRIPGDGIRPGVQLKGGGDRRVTRSDLLDFMIRNGMPTNSLEAVQGAALLVGVDALLAQRVRESLGGGYRLDCVDGWLEAGAALQRDRPRVLVIDFSLGRSECMRTAGEVRKGQRWGQTILVALANEDERSVAALIGTFDAALRKPLDPVEVADAITRAVNGELVVGRKVG